MTDKMEECNICMNYKTSDETMCKKHICSECQKTMKNYGQDTKCPFCRQVDCSITSSNVAREPNYFLFMGSISTSDQPIWEGSYIGWELEEFN